MTNPTKKRAKIQNGITSPRHNQKEKRLAETRTAQMRIK
jgi:hypothetical protein